MVLLGESKLYKPRLHKRLKNKVAKLDRLKTKIYQIGDGAILLAALDFSSPERIRRKFRECSKKFSKEYYMGLTYPEPNYPEDQRYCLEDRLGDYFVEYGYMDKVVTDKKVFYRTTFKGRQQIDFLIQDKKIFDLFGVKLEPLQ